MAFQPRNIEHDIRIQRANNKVDLHYECTSAGSDASFIASKYPQMIADALINKHNFKLKGTRPTSHHLNCDFTRDDSNEL